MVRIFVDSFHYYEVRFKTAEMRRDWHDYREFGKIPEVVKDYCIAIMTGEIKPILQLEEK